MVKERACIFLLLLILNFSSSVYAQTPLAEYKIKAVYLFNFVQYVEWPGDAFTSEQSPLVIGILGSDPFGSFLDETVNGETVRGRKLVVQRHENLGEARKSHLLFVSSSEESRLNSILAEVRGKSILTVSDMDGFAVKGGLVRFLNKENKVRFRFNVKAAKDCNLAISSKLLQLAEIVETR